MQTNRTRVVAPTMMGRSLIWIGGQGRNRTTDTRIFSPLLYQLSYLAVLREPGEIPEGGVLNRSRAGGSSDDADSVDANSYDAGARRLQWRFTPAHPPANHACSCRSSLSAAIAARYPSRAVRRLQYAPAFSGNDSSGSRRR